MYKRKKPNTHEEVYRRIENLRAKLLEIVEYSEAGILDYKIKPIPVRRNIVNFLSGHGVGISLVRSRRLEERLDDKISKPKRGLAERTYRLSQKILKKNWEERNPVPVLYTVLDIFSGGNGNSEMIGSMNDFSDSISFDYDCEINIMPDVIMNLFPEIVNDYRNALEDVKASTYNGKIVEEKTKVIQDMYKEGLGLFMKAIHDLLEEYSIKELDEVGRKELINQIEEVKQKSFAFGEDSISEIINQPTFTSYKLQPSDIADLSKSGDGVETFENEYGSTLALQNKSPSNTPREYVITRTDKSRIKVNFPQGFGSREARFFLSLCKNAKERNFGSNERYMEVTNITMKYLQQRFNLAL